MAAMGGLFSMARYLTRHRVRIFAYHGVSRDVDPALNFDGFFVHPDVFERHLRTLKGHYHVMSLSEIVQSLTEGRPLPKGASAITFDDGYMNNLSEAAPLLAQYRLPATFFVTTGFIDGTHEPWWFTLRAEVFRVQGSGFRLPDGVRKELKTREDRVQAVIAWETHLKNLSAEMRNQELTEIISEPRTLNPESCALMTWAHLRELAAQGHEIGAHTVSHISLGHETPDVVEREIIDSIARVRDDLGSVCPVYSYPYGEAAHFSSSLGDVLRRQDCIGGVTTLEGMNPPGTDSFQLKRLNVTGRHDRYAFRALASGFTGMLKQR